MNYFFFFKQGVENYFYLRFQFNIQGVTHKSNQVPKSKLCMKTFAFSLLTLALFTLDILFHDVIKSFLRGIRPHEILAGRRVKISSLDFSQGVKCAYFRDFIFFHSGMAIFRNSNLWVPNCSKKRILKSVNMEMQFSKNQTVPNRFSLHTPKNREAISTHQ